MRISDWSSDVCSSDLGLIRRRGYTLAAHDSTSRQLQQATVVSAGRSRDAARAPALGRLIGELTRNEIQLAELDHIDVRRVGQIPAPVFTAAASIPFQLVLIGLPRPPTLKNFKCHTTGPQR